MPDFFLGGPVDDAGERTGERLSYDAAHLTTHGVIVGMTGSGKTGLGMIFLEEALRAGIPTLVLDPKGDMTNLALRFPELRPEDFLPWIDPAEASAKGTTVADLAASTAERWREGLASWGLSSTDVATFVEGADVTIYTPGSRAGVPLDIVGRLDPPDLDWERDTETLRDEIEGFASGLLGLIGIEADPITSREHILISNLLEHAWRRGTALDMETLLRWIQEPPFRKLGVFEVDEFFPAKERLALAMALNGLLAAPGFEVWMEGTPLDVPSLLWDEAGRPRAAVIYLAHLSDEERQFVVTLVLSRLITWMRSQPGTDELRVLTYMDEVFGFVPPTAAPPAKKPILTLLKQARAFGVGMLLATQNPVDLDYKAMSNAGTWAIGRLQTERDKLRIVEALASARGDVDVDELAERISGLGKRRFLLHDVRAAAPRVFTTRWAMSFLRGPLTRDQISTLMADRRPASAPPEPATSAAVPARDGDEGSEMPPIAAGTPVHHLDPAAPWADLVGADPASRTYEAGIYARVLAHYDERRAGLAHDEEWEAIFFPAPEPFDPAGGIEVDYDARDLRASAPEGARHLPPRAPLEAASYFRDARRALADHVARTGELTIYRNRELGLWSRPDEDRDAFEARCRRVADERADEALAALRDRYEERIRRIRRRIAEADRKLTRAQEELDAVEREALMDQASAVVGMLLGRRNRRSLTAATRRRRSAERRVDRAAERASDAREELAELEEELADDVAEITEEWTAKAGEIEAVEVGLERDDVRVVELGVVWIPVPAENAG